LRAPGPLLILLLALPLPALGLQQGPCVPSSPSFKLIDAFWGTPSGPLDAAPGDVNAALTVRLLYYGACDLVAVEGRLALPAGFEGVEGGNSSSVAAPGPPPGQVSVLTFTLNILSSAALGEHQFLLHLLWNTTTNYATQDIPFSIALRGRPLITLLPGQTSLWAGQVNSVRILLANEGDGDATSLELSASPSPILALLSPLPPIPKLAGGTFYALNTSLYAPLSAAGSSSYLTLSISYRDPYGLERVVQRTIFFYVQASARASPLSVEVRPSVLNASEINRVSLRLANMADEPLLALQASVASPTSPITWLSPALVTLQRLEPGQEVNIEGELYVPSGALGSALLEVMLSYYSSQGQPYQEARRLGLLVKGKVNVSAVDVSLLPPSPPAGGIFSATITLVNIGTSPALNLIATPIPPAGISVLGQRSVYIGDLAMRAPTTLTLTFSVDNRTQPGAYSVPILLSYQDNLGFSSSQSLVLNIEVAPRATAAAQISPSARSAALPVWLAVLAAGIIGGLMGYFTGRRRA
jgi:hypothetical protein